jgi:hypothetical protein
MADHGTTSNRDLGWYIQFQTDVLSQLPRPGQISEETVWGWHKNREALKRALGKFLLPPTKAVTDSLLELVGTVTVPASKKFVVIDHFRVSVGASANAEVKISWLGGDFRFLFLNKTEEPSGETKLLYQRLCKESLDQPILDELGDLAQVSLSAVWELLKLQSHGQGGVLLTNGRANIFYVRDINGTLRSVSVWWSTDYGYWNVGAFSVKCRDGWHSDERVFSRLPADMADNVHSA